MKEETFEKWNKNLGEFVLSKRTELQLSREGLAKLSSVDARNLKKLEGKDGADLPKLSTLNKLADTFGMSLIDLVEEMTEE